ncbi:MAG: uncharacterized protein QOK37_1383 [Thermoanaerobaculia bacterium]|jgi:uncharacterized protein YggE|nr:uncharacterized protein [Thermoanaerobaculia bacterium]
MKTTTYVAVLLVLIPALLQAQGVTAPPPPPPPLTETQVLVPGQNVVIVSGTSSVAMTPDMVSVSLGVSTKGETVRRIVKENNAKVAKIIEILKAKGMRSDQIKTSSFELAPVERNAIRTGFEVSNTIGVSSKQVSDVGALVDAAIDSGANQIRGPEFSVENEKVVQERCIAEAFRDAKAKAKQLAALSERELGRVLAVTDGSSSPFELKYRSGIDGGVLGGVIMEPGVHTVQCGVTVAFELR